ncbi:hypothetical protein ACIBO5_57825 [Nonomuraea angiospora]|uniref:hypothetical protein n=1 Tax=Nonomuraea angiospora TaxID=46172 RepID=UPI0029B653DE|nr:hypothetical protein [Nonomuraea angiospora]MDX3108154.1 hypothetical protein [Nonomuraea angiospora]
MAELDALFTETVQAVTRPEHTRLRLELVFSPEAAARAAELAARENGCCSFFTFTFTFTIADGTLALEVTVPAEHVDVLEALQARAGATEHLPGARNVSGQVSAELAAQVAPDRSATVVALHAALRRRDVYAIGTDRWGDPRGKLIPQPVWQCTATAS